MLILVILIAGYSLFFSLLLSYKKIIGVFQNNDKQFSPVKYALIVGGGITTWFTVWVLVVIFNPMHSTVGIGLIFLLPCATLLGIGGFLVSWSVITLYGFFSSKHRSTIPKKKLFLHTVFSILTLVIMSVSIYIFTTRQLLLRDAKSPQISQARLEEIYTRAMGKHNFRVLERLALNPQTSTWMLEDMYESSPGNIRFSLFYPLARNKNTPTKILEELAKSSWASVRSAVGSNPNTPVEVLRILAGDVDYSVRIAVTKNPNITRDILIKLKSDKDPLVSKHASDRLIELGLNK